MSKVKLRKIQKLNKKFKVVAIADGYYKNRIIKAGKKFIYDGPFRVKDGKELAVLPQWVKDIDKMKKEKEEAEFEEIVDHKEESSEVKKEDVLEEIEDDSASLEKFV